MKMMENEKVYFLPGDLVTLKQDLPNKPIMLVVKKETMTFRPDKDEEKKEEFFKGIKCRWFTINGSLQEAIFNTKDLVKV